MAVTQASKNKLASVWLPLFSRLFPGINPRKQKQSVARGDDKEALNPERLYFQLQP